MIQQTTNFVFFIIAALVCLFNLGCGNSGGATVSGTVEIDGKPIPEGRVVFSSQTTTCAGEIVDGKYQLKNKGESNIPLDNYTITVFPPGNTVVFDPETGEEEAVTAKVDRNLYPDKYQQSKTSDLKFSPVAGDNDFDIILEK